MSYSNYYLSSGFLHVSVPMLMGTQMDALLFGDDRRQLEKVWKSAENELILLEKMLNRFDPESEISKINTNAQFSEVRISDELWNILLDCRRYHKNTDGFFDITCRDFEKIIFKDDSKSIHFDQYGMFFDFGAYGKGYALKGIRHQLELAGIKRALVNFGNSSVLALGAHPHGDSWPVGVVDPANGSTIQTISLFNNALSVSGNTLSRQSHIINPKTSELVTGDRMVAVVTDDPIDADVLTTAWIASENETVPDWMLKFDLKNTYKIK